MAFRLGALKDSSLVARRILTYRHQLVASPSYLKTCKPPKHPQDLLEPPAADLFLLEARE